VLRCARVYEKRGCLVTQRSRSVYPQMNPLYEERAEGATEVTRWYMYGQRYCAKYYRHTCIWKF